MEIDGNLFLFVFNVQISYLFTFIIFSVVISTNY